jgi:hypothetical protein
MQQHSNRSFHSSVDRPNGTLDPAKASPNFSGWIQISRRLRATNLPLLTGVQQRRLNGMVETSGAGAL